MIDNKLMETYVRPDVIFKEGKGSYLYDQDGNAYLDLVAGVAVNALGHCSPVMVEALTEQANQLIHLSNLYWTEKQLSLAAFLIEKSHHEAVFFNNSGTESLETAIKISRKYGKQFSDDKHEIIYLEKSFHGRWVGALSITGQAKYQTPFMPLMGGTRMIPSNDIEALEKAISEKTCAVFIEPIQGEGGIIPLDKTYLEGVRALCDQYKALLVFDEVQCGIGRTGSFYAYETVGVDCDVVCLAKGLGGGFPIGAVLANAKANVLKPGDHGCTFGGSPLACATSYAVVNEVAKPEFLASVKEKGQWVKEKVVAELEGHPAFEKIVGEGLMLGIHLNVQAKPISQKAFEQKLLAITAGEKVIRIVPALNIDQVDLEKGINLLIGLIKDAE